MENLTHAVTVEIRSHFGRKVYAVAGTPVRIISISGHVAIVADGKGERFPVETKYLKPCR
jgi:hypothetical protein